MNTTVAPTIGFPTPSEDPSATITLNAGASGWTDARTYVASYDVADIDAVLMDIDVRVSGATYAVNTVLADADYANMFSIATRTPTVSMVMPSVATIKNANVGVAAFRLTLVFTEAMNTTVAPTIGFPTPSEDPSATIALNAGASGWLSSTVYEAYYDVTDSDMVLPNVDVRVTVAQAVTGNVVDVTLANRFSIDTLNP